MKKLFLIIVMSTALASPAFAGKKDRGNQDDRSVERLESQLERFESKLETATDPGRIEAIQEKLEAIQLKIDTIVPPEPEPERVELLKDDFNRNTTEVGNGWRGTEGSIDGEQLRITDGGRMFNTVDLGGKKYESITVSFDVVGDPNSESGAVVNQDVTMFWTEGDPSQNNGDGGSITTEMWEFPDHTHYSLTTPVKSEDDPEPYYTSFGFGFFPVAGGSATIDNVTVTGVLYTGGEDALTQ